MLDIGSGTGTLAILIKQACPKILMIGADIDRQVIRVAQSKISNNSVDVVLVQSTAVKVPFPDNSFDKITSSLMMHHLNANDKLLMLKEVLRLLKPGGQFYLADLGKPHNALMYFPSLIMRHLEKAGDNVKGLLPIMFEEAGFHRVVELKRYMSVFGSISVYVLTKELGSS